MGKAREPRKYEPGSPFTNLTEVANWCEAGSYVFAFGSERPIHGSFIMGQHLRTIVLLIGAGRLRRAYIRREWLEWAAERSAA